MCVKLPLVLRVAMGCANTRGNEGAVPSPGAVEQG